MAYLSRLLTLHDAWHHAHVIVDAIRCARQSELEPWLLALKYRIATNLSDNCRDQRAHEEAMDMVAMLASKWMHRHNGQPTCSPCWRKHRGTSSAGNPEARNAGRATLALAVMASKWVHR